MIFYFSGTGNTRWVAKELANRFNDKLMSITDLLAGNETEYRFAPRERVILVCPVHSWGPPEPVNRFLRRLTLEGNPEVWAVATCGDECGLTDRMLTADFAARGIALKGCFSVTMPNNYILMRGFEVDSKEVEQLKLDAAPERVAQIERAIREGSPAAASLYEVGPYSWLKSRVVYPLFIRFELGKSAFRFTDKCVGCGVCKKLCPTRNIEMIHKEPVWGNDCVQCAACIHRCPFRAIEYGKITLKKGRYVHPSLR